MSKSESSSVTSPFKKFKNDRALRPPPPELDTAQNNFIFQQIELDHYQGSFVPGMPGAQSGPVPIIRMFGVTSSGNSVCCHIHGFSPYFFVSLPNTFKEDDCKPFKDKLNSAVIADLRLNKKNLQNAILRVQIVNSQSVLEYTGDESRLFAKITVALPRLIAPTKRLLERTQLFPVDNHHEFRAFESNLDIDMRFMVDANIVGCCWIEIAPGMWTLRPSRDLLPTTLCQIEIDVAYDKIIAHTPEGEWATVAPFRIHSFDIECAGRPGEFPVPKIDPVIQIANVVQLHGSQDHIVCNVFTLNSCAPIEHAEVHSFKTEAEMLRAWAEFVKDVDPDLFTGYNIIDFDFPYLLNRAAHLNVQDFPYLGRLKNVRSIVNETKIGRRTFATTKFEGRILYDMFVVMKRDFKLPSYTLNNVSKEILNEQKEDVHYSKITGLQNGDEQTRRRLAVYCVKDAMLPMCLINHVKSFINDIEKARVTGVSITSLLTKGEQVKIVAHLLRHNSAAPLSSFEKLLNKNSVVFYQSRTAKSLQRHWLTLRMYHLLPDQSVAPLPNTDHPAVLTFTDAIQDADLQKPLDEALDREIRLAQRKNAHEIRHLENELGRWNVLVDSVTGA